MRCALAAAHGQEGRKEKRGVAGDGYRTQERTHTYRSERSQTGIGLCVKDRRGRLW